MTQQQQTIHAALMKLGDGINGNSAEVAAKLLALKCFGGCTSRDCPIAIYLIKCGVAKRPQITGISVIENEDRATTSLEYRTKVDLPFFLTRFVSHYDAGMYPELRQAA